MHHELDTILISPSQPDFQNKIKTLHQKLKKKARFGGLEEKPVWEIIRKVSEQGDKAVAEYTEKYDHVKLKPSQFRISREDLEKAHQQIDKLLLASIKQAIENVSNYQKEIFIGNDKRGYEIWVFNLEGNLIRKIRKKYRPVFLTDEEKKKKMKFFSKFPENFRKRIYFPKHMPPFMYLFTDDEGRLFVITHEKGKNAGEYLSDIYNSEGIFIGRTQIEGVQIKAKRVKQAIVSLVVDRNG